MSSTKCLALKTNGQHCQRLVSEAGSLVSKTGSLVSKTKSKCWQHQISGGSISRHELSIYDLFNYPPTRATLNGESVLIIPVDDSRPRQLLNFFSTTLNTKFTNLHSVLSSVIDYRLGVELNLRFENGQTAFMFDEGTEVEMNFPDYPLLQNVQWVIDYRSPDLIEFGVVGYLS